MRADNPNGTSMGSAMFAQMTAECHILYNSSPVSRSKLPLQPTRVLNPNGNAIASTVFAGLTSGVTD